MFYLYQSSELNNHILYDYDIFDIFKDNKLRVYDISCAHYCITCIRNSNKKLYKKEKSKNIYKEISILLGNLKFINTKIHVVFFHTFRSELNNLNIINISYHNNNYDSKSLNICPPSLLNLKFNNNINRKFLCSFKGTFETKMMSRNKCSRYDILTKLQEYNDLSFIIIETNNNNYSYEYLLNNSYFGLVVEGDLPWSYRLTETINSGCIPVIIKDKMKSLPFQQYIDYSKFSIIIEKEYIQDIKKKLNEISKEKIIKYLNELKYVNENYFISLKIQMKSVEKFLEYNYNT